MNSTVKQHSHKGKVSTAHKMELFVIQDFQEMEGWHIGVCECVGGLWWYTKGEKAPHTPKYLEQILNGFACNLHNRTHFCKTIETRGSNPMF